MRGLADAGEQAQRGGDDLPIALCEDDRGGQVGSAEVVQVAQGGRDRRPHVRWPVGVHVGGATVGEFGVLQLHRVERLESLDPAGGVPVDQDERSAEQVGVGDDPLPEIESGEPLDRTPSNQRPEGVVDPLLLLSVHAVDVNVERGDRLGDFLDTGPHDGHLESGRGGESSEAVEVVIDLGETSGGDIFAVSPALLIRSGRGECIPKAIEEAHVARRSGPDLGDPCHGERSEALLPHPLELLVRVGTGVGVSTPPALVASFIFWILPAIRPEVSRPSAPIADIALLRIHQRMTFSTSNVWSSWTSTNAAPWFHWFRGW